MLPAGEPDPQKLVVRRLMYVFALVYVAEGWANLSGVISQPLQVFLRDGLKWSADDIGRYSALIGLPWVAKPLYGLISDCVPILGYRRKSYLVITNALAVIAYLCVSFTLSASGIFLPLAAVTAMMALSSAICGALVIEHARNSPIAGTLVGQQSLWANLSTISATFVGGWLCSSFSPTTCLFWAGLVAIVAPLVVVFTCWELVSEERTKADWVQFRAGLKAIWAAIGMRPLWGVAGLLALWAFSPGFGIVMFIHMTEDLGFSQNTVGMLRACFAAGSAAGAFIYMRYLGPRVSLKVAAIWLIILGASVQCAFLFMSSVPVAIILHVLNGMMTAMVSVNSHVIAANRCPDRAEGFTYGTLVAIGSFSYIASNYAGGWLFDHVFSHQSGWLIAISAAFTLCSLAVVPFFNFKKSPA